MNFLAGQLLMHCKSALAFWIFVDLIEECELRDIFEEGLPGMHKHAQIIRLLVEKHLPELHDLFEEHSVTPECYASEWIFSLFCSILPEDETKITAMFFTKFLQFKWEFFYKLVLTILTHVK